MFVLQVCIAIVLTLAYFYLLACLLFWEDPLQRYGAAVSRAKKPLPSTTSQNQAAPQDQAAARTVEPTPLRSPHDTATKKKKKKRRPKQILSNIEIPSSSHILPTTEVIPFHCQPDPTIMVIPESTAPEKAPVTASASTPSTVPEPQQSPCLILRLPPEIRLMIYKLLFPHIGMARHVHLGSPSQCRPACDGASKRLITRGSGPRSYRMEPDFWLLRDDRTLHHAFCNDLWRDGGEEIRIRRIVHGFSLLGASGTKPDRKDDGINFLEGQVVLWAEAQDYLKRRKYEPGMLNPDSRSRRYRYYRHGSADSPSFHLTPLLLSCSWLYEEIMSMCWRSVSFADLASMALFLDIPVHSTRFRSQIQRMSVDVELPTHMSKLGKAVRIWSTVCEILTLQCRLQGFKLRLDVDVDAHPRAGVPQQLMTGVPIKKEREDLSIEERIPVSNKWVKKFLEELNRVAKVVPEVEVEVAYNEIRRQKGASNRLCRVFRPAAEDEKVVLEGGIEVGGWSVTPRAMPQSRHWRLNIWRVSEPGWQKLGKAREREYRERGKYKFWRWDH